MRDFAHHVLEDALSRHSSCTRASGSSLECYVEALALTLTAPYGLHSNGQAPNTLF